MKENCFVYFVGAGPGDPELITVKGQKLLQRADLILYAGSLVPPALFQEAKALARIEDSSGMTLEETHALLCAFAKKSLLAVRLHTGDPSLYGAVREQRLLLNAEGIQSRIVPGVSAAFAAAAAAGLSFTVPESVQSFAITRVNGRTPVEKRESIKAYAKHQGALAIYLSGGDAEQVQEELLAGGAAQSSLCVIASKVGWPDEKIVRCPLSALAKTAKSKGFTRQVLFLLFPGEQQGQVQIEKDAHKASKKLTIKTAIQEIKDKKGEKFSRLYAQDFSHGYREKKVKKEK